MNRLIPPLLLLLLICSGSAVFAAYEWNQNEQLTKDKADLKQQLDATTAKLQQAADEKQQLQAELNQTQNETNELQDKVSTLEQQVQNQTREIEKLREQLKIQGYTTIGLTFLWNPTTEGITDELLAGQVHYLNIIWDPVGVYFFLYHAAPQPFVPVSGDICQLDKWVSRAKALYSGSDIPIAIQIASKPGDPAIGCGYLGAIGVGILRDYLNANTLTHELLHNFGAVESVIPHEDRPWSPFVIPSALYPQLITVARQFQMPIPNDGS